MNINNWNPYLKLSEEAGTPCMAQQTYEPLINPEGNVFCANYDWQNKYQRIEETSRPLYTKEVVDHFFEREVKYLLKFQNKPYTPKVLDIDYDKKHIFYRWKAPSCNQIIYSGKDLNEHCPAWKDQIKFIMTDIHKEGTYKLTMYPHCHFVEDGRLKTIDWYGCVEVNDPYIDSTYMDGIIHRTAKFRLEETGGIINSKYNLEEMFKKSLGTHVMWGEDSMDFVYKEIFKDAVSV